MVTTGYTDSEMALLNGFVSTRLGTTVAQFQHDAVSAWRYLYIVGGITTPTPIPILASGPNTASTFWVANDLSTLDGVGAQWAQPRSATQKTAVLVLAFLIITYG